MGLGHAQARWFLWWFEADVSGISGVSGLLEDFCVSLLKVGQDPEARVQRSPPARGQRRRRLAWDELAAPSVAPIPLPPTHVPPCARARPSANAAVLLFCERK